MTFADQLKTYATTANLPSRPVKAAPPDENTDILKSWLIESLAKPPARIRPPRRADQQTMAVKLIGDGYWLASIPTKLNVYRGLSPDRDSAIKRCNQLHGGRS
jgi:hypothetical protein